ncbi:MULTISPECIES: glucosamine-6-phosphate deaminase [Arenibacter]|uniref:glucosamine-6-phosphate deaminase n=1 Tax=Arenibacter TaxID=178469 RepID=UPI0004DED14C|nr:MULTISPECIES: glucosamine-6-phosphate deaminase [Arenibacter]GBF18674.1 glucosamine-6-phosphate deaminase 1 [Arenibacter sp. NBRC 103722]|tara:strand:- start:1410 stop:2171 length:762 start_codon:yes stop_codon:yes gene_type:complete
MEKSFQIENLSIEIYGQSKEMGAAAADYVTRKLNDAIVKKGGANLILATGASQFSFLEALQTKEIDWGKITVFHLDEYKGISESHPASFRKYLKERILNKVAPKKIYFLNGDAANLQLEIKNYEEALQAHPIDIACIGIGENGHIAFNDPAVADFQDPKLVKVVELDEACRNQQLGEGWFPSFDDVPKEAVTLTITAIMNCEAISCVVPDERKSQAVYNSLYGDISTSCPASILRTHPETVLFLDKASASLIK